MPTSPSQTMAADDETSAVTIQSPPHLIKAKTQLKRGTADAMLEKAEALLSGLISEYEAILDRDIRQLRVIFDQQWSQMPRRPDASHALFTLAHDIRGQGSTFDYPLISSIADHFCKYLERVPLDAQRGEDIAAHIDALTAIATRKIRSDGGPVGRAIVAGLHRIVEKRTTATSAVTSELHMLR